MEINTVEEAVRLLKSLNAPHRLVKHHLLVAEAGQELVDGLHSLFNLKFDSQLVLVGAALHDCGKILYPQEMDQPGNIHETAGENLLLQQGVSPQIARFCRTHAQWNQLESTFEDLLVAVSDKLWKGKREKELENAIANYIAKETQLPIWQVFVLADSLFEKIASKGDMRLEKSIV